MLDLAGLVRPAGSEEAEHAAVLVRRWLRVLLWYSLRWPLWVVTLEKIADDVGECRGLEASLDFLFLLLHVVVGPLRLL